MLYSHTKKRKKSAIHTQVLVQIQVKIINTTPYNYNIDTLQYDLASEMETQEGVF